MYRIDAAIDLLEAEAKDRLRLKEDRDYVAVLYGVCLEVYDAVGQKMKHFRDIERIQKRKINH